MKTKAMISGFCLLGALAMSSCNSAKQSVVGNGAVENSIARRMSTKLTKDDRRWNVHLNTINFVDESPESKGSQIYHALIPNPDPYIRSVAREVMRCLYFSPEDSIPMLYTLDYIIREDPGVSAKGGGNGHVNIFYSTNHVEKSFANKDTVCVDFETRGVLLHELTHAFQLEPQGIGHYGGPNKAFWEIIEGTADAVRVACDGFHGEIDRPKGGSYHDGYRYIGYFFNWLRLNKDKDFIRKMNRSCLEVVPWSWDGAIQYALGPGYTIDALWNEYQIAVGDIEETQRTKPLPMIITEATKPLPMIITEATKPLETTKVTETVK